MAWKGTTGLRTGSEASKVHVLLLGGPILSGLEVSCPQKPNGDAPHSVSLFGPKTPKERHNGLERNDRTQNGVGGLESSRLATGWSDSERSRSFLPTKAKR